MNCFLKSMMFGNLPLLEIPVGLSTSLDTFANLSHCQIISIINYIRLHTGGQPRCAPCFTNTGSAVFWIMKFLHLSNFHVRNSSTLYLQTVSGTLHGLKLLVFKNMKIYKNEKSLPTTLGRTIISAASALGQGFRTPGPYFWPCYKFLGPKFTSIDNCIFSLAYHTGHCLW